jgi:hypothetical protein
MGRMRGWARAVKRLRQHGQKSPSAGVPYLGKIARVTVMDYLLSPLERRLGEAGRER